MSNVHTPPRSGFEREEPAVESYRAVSRSAVAASLLGIASPLVLVSPLLAVIPLAAIVTAVVGLRNVVASGGQLVGRRPALIGLCLAMFSLGCGLGWTLSRQARIESQARKFADEWLAIVASGEHQRAHQMRLTPMERAQPGSSLDDFYKTKPEIAKDLQELVTGPALAEFVMQGHAAAYRFEALVAQQKQGTTDQIVLQYSYDRPRGEPRRIWITVNREVDEEGAANWRIDRVEAFNPVA